MVDLKEGLQNEFAVCLVKTTDNGQEIYTSNAPHILSSKKNLATVAQSLLKQRGLI